MKSPMFSQNTENETDNDDFEPKKKSPMNNIKRKKQIQLKRKFGNRLEQFLKN